MGGEGGGSGLQTFVCQQWPESILVSGPFGGSKGVAPPCDSPRAVVSGCTAAGEGCQRATATGRFVRRSHDAVQWQAPACLGFTGQCLEGNRPPTAGNGPITAGRQRLNTGGQPSTVNFTLTKKKNLLQKTVNRQSCPLRSSLLNVQWAYISGYDLGWHGPKACPSPSAPGLIPAPAPAPAPARPCPAPAPGPITPPYPTHAVGFGW